MPNETRVRWRLANSVVSLAAIWSAMSPRLDAAISSQPYLARDHRHLRAGVLAHDAVFHDLDRGAAPVLIERAGFIFFDLVLDDDVQVELLALAALHLEAVVAL